MTDGYCRQPLRQAVRLSARLFVCPSRTTFALQLFTDFSYQLEIWWYDSQYHGADRY